MSSLETLIRGLFACGGYEKGHAYLREHAAEITSEFVDQLRVEAMALLTAEDSDPALAKTFAELAIIAAIHLGTDYDKGMAFYCKGSILSRVREYNAAWEHLQDAQEYLSAAGNTAQLANCLFDAAIVFDRLGNYQSALRLLKEALSYQSDEKQRADSMAFMLVLTQRNGGNVEQLLDELIRQRPKRNFTVSRVAEPDEMRHTCEEILANRPTGWNRELFRASIPAFLAESSGYYFFRAEEGGMPPYASGVLKRYRDTFNDRDMLGLESVAFADSDIEAHLEVIGELRKFATELDADVLCISESGLGQPETFKTLLADFNRRSEPSIAMQGAQPGVYCAFTESPGTRTFFAPCLPIPTRNEHWDFSGTHATNDRRLYRGEGRLEYASRRANWTCPDLEQLARHFFRHGFHGRAEGSFPGSMQAQILHQGYVDQSTVSLSASFEVCAYYATDQHRREIGGVVFEIDTRALAERAPVYDSLATLEKSCPWLLSRFSDQIVKIMKALDGDRNDVRASGEFLQRCHTQSRQRVESFGGGRTLGPPIDWTTILSPREHTKLQANKLTTDDLDAINDEFEIFWNIALGKMIRGDRIDAATGEVTTEDLPRAYFVAFDQVHLQLKERWRLNQYSKHNHPGWDLSPFGYVTKTLRDQEFFTSGDVPGECLLEAVIVDQAGKERMRIPNQQAHRSAGV